MIYSMSLHDGASDSLSLPQVTLPNKGDAEAAAPWSI